MVRLRQIGKASVLSGLRSCTRSLHGWLTLLGLSMGLWYLPAWMSGLLDRGPQSTDGVTLAACFVGLSGYLLWKQHKQLTSLEASEEDRLLGHVLILCGVGLFPFCRFAIWPQALLWGLILVGIACSHWGLKFFAEQKMLAISVFLTLYPQPAVTARLLWEAVTPYKFLERLMAQAGAVSLRGGGVAGVGSRLVRDFSGGRGGCLLGLQWV